MAMDTEALSAEDGKAGMVKLGLMVGVGGVEFDCGSTISLSDVVTPIFEVEEGFGVSVLRLDGGGGGGKSGRDSSDGNKDAAKEEPLEGLLILIEGLCFGTGGGNVWSEW